MHTDEPQDTQKPSTQDLAANACDEMSQAILPLRYFSTGAEIPDAIRAELMKRLTAAIHACAQLLVQLSEDE